MEPRLLCAPYLTQTGPHSWESPDGSCKVDRVLSGHGGTAYEVSAPGCGPRLVSSLAEALDVVARVHGKG